jgi:SMI1 / KNR4 family (SUKH-1)
MKPKQQPMPLEKLIPALSEALRKRDRLVLDEEYPHELGEPCTPAQLDALERIVGKPLPPSYRAFMTRHNGWNRLVGDAKILAVQDYGSAWVKQRLEDLGTLFYEFGPDPFEAGAIPIMLGRTAKGFLVLDPSTVRKNGEMDFVSYDDTEREDKFPDFNAFLHHKLNLVQQMIDDETKGSSDDEDDE